MSTSNLHVIARKTLAIKRSDGEPLTRTDIQYDLLCHIFGDSQAVFTNPYPTPDGHPAGMKVAFKDLYLNSLMHSPRTSKALRDRMLDLPQFATDFAMVSLLANVGRINTTMAFFPEMRTALRTYHPVPSLQKTDENLSDAPRIKSILKSCLLDSEADGAPSTPADILARSQSGKVPPTSVVNLIFVLASHSTPLAQNHFYDSLEFLDLFTPVPVASSSRAQVFLWLCYHYLETASPNPFADERAKRNPGKIPLLRMLTPEEMALENVDTPQEIEWGNKMVQRRSEFQAKKGKDGDDKLGRKGRRSERKIKADTPHQPTPQEKNYSRKDKFLVETPARGRQLPQPYHQRTSDHPYERTPVDVNDLRLTPPSRPSRRPNTSITNPPLRSRTMLENAWTVITTTDPLLDSDDENPGQHVRLDYIRRLRILSRLRGKEPTPEPEPYSSPVHIDTNSPFWIPR